jgi:hypothetical protein
MKSLGDPAFFRLFDLLTSLTNRGLKRSRWTHDGVEFERERHSFTGPKHGLAIEISTLTRPGRRGWSLMVIKEYWWAGEESRALKNLRWARPLSGQRGDILSWLRTQQGKIDHEPLMKDLQGSNDGSDEELRAIDDTAAGHE